MLDIGTIEQIEYWANREGAELTYATLESQFRCNGSDGYLAWLDNFLGIRATANDRLEETGYNLAVCSSANQLRRKITELNKPRNRARLVAGYCWPWNSKKDPDAMDIVIAEEQFEMQWNLNKDGSLWIISKDSVDQVGCIHTCQGLEVDWIGVILGPDLVIRNGKWICDSKARARGDKSVHGMKKLLTANPVKGRQMESLIIKNTYRTLMTRGMKGCLLWSSDHETQTWLINQLPRA